jgi:uroporphyrinogen decarboxylase
MNHRARLEACIAGERVDRPPIALWRHFPVDDQSPGSLAAATVDFQKTYDFDLVKVTPASSFCVKDWGIDDEWRGATEGTRDYTLRAIRNIEDWWKLTVLDPRIGYLGGQLNCLQQIVEALDPDVPVLQTIFSPLSQAKNLVGKEKLLVHLRQDADAVHKGLRCITESTRLFVQAAMQTGISGVFYAIQHAQYGLMSEPEYAEFGKAYDLQILEVANSLWLNMLHLHGEDVMFDLVVDYPVAVINWHDRDTQPSLQEGKNRFPGTVCGGLQRERTMVLGTPSQVIVEAQDAFLATQGNRFILGTGCVVPITAPRANIMAARQSVELMNPLS